MQGLLRLKIDEERTMYRTVMWTTAIGAGIGVFSAIEGSVGLMVVMGLFGAVFGCAMGSGLCLVLMAFKTKNSAGHQFLGKQEADMENGLAFDSYEEAKIGKKWMDDREQFPIAGDPDPVARAMTGSPDLANLHRDREF